MVLGVGDFGSFLGMELVPYKKNPQSSLPPFVMWRHSKKLPVGYVE